MWNKKNSKIESGDQFSAANDPFAPKSGSNDGLKTNATFSIPKNLPGSEEAPNWGL